MSDQSRVFMLERCNFDVTKAERFGQLVYLFDREDERAGIWSVGEYETDLEIALTRENFSPEFDYFVCSGYIISTTIAIARIVAEFGFCNVLFFDARTRDYFPRIVGDTANAPKGNRVVHNRT